MGLFTERQKRIQKRFPSTGVIKWQGQGSPAMTTAQVAMGVAPSLTASRQAAHVIVKKCHLRVSRSVSGTVPRSLYEWSHSLLATTPSAEYFTDRETEA